MTTKRMLVSGPESVETVVIRQLSIAESAKLQFAGGLILASVLNLARYPFQEAGIGER